MKRALCTAANTDEGTRPLNNTRTLWALGLTKSCKLHRCYDPAIAGAARVAMREEGRGGEDTWGKVRFRSLWMLESDKELRPLENTLVLSPLHTWPELDDIQHGISGPPLLRYSFPFIPHFPANGCVSTSSPLCKRPVQHFIKPKRILQWRCWHTHTHTQALKLTDIMVHLIKRTTLVFGCKDSKGSA